MSGSQTQQGGAQPGSAGADPSMEDILASIRRILSEEDVPTPPSSQGASSQGASSQGAPSQVASSQGAEPEQEQDVLLLDSSMLVAEVPPPRPAIRPRAVPPPPPPVLLQPEEVPAEPAPVEAKQEEVAAPELKQPEPIQPEAATPAADMAESILVEITTEQLMVSGEFFAAVANAVEQPAVPEVAIHAEVPEFAPVKMEAPMPAEAIPPLTPATGLQGSPVLVPVPRSGLAAAAPIFDRVPSVPREPPVTNPPPSPTTETQSTPPKPPSTPTTPQSESSVMSASMSSTGLASAETANAAAGSVTNLVRALTSDRSSQVFGGGPTVADLVREELRPMLKAWLDSNLPPLVERLVRAEIERVISRATV